MQSMTKFTFAALVAASAFALPGLASAAALDQFKSFVASTQSAKG